MLVTKDKVVLSTPVIDLILCEDDHTGVARKRHGIVHKQRATISGVQQFQNAAGQPVSIVTAPVYEDVLKILLDSGRRIQELEKDVERYKVQAESYKTLVDTLKKNGVID